MSNESSQMIKVIIDNLTTTFQNSEGKNENIRQSEEFLLSLSQTPDFYPILFTIIQSSDFSISIQKASLIYLQNLIKHHFLLISESSKHFLISNYPTLIKNSLQFIQIYRNLTENLINCTFFASSGWPNLFEIIHSGFSQFELDQKQGFVSIILLNSISKYLKNHEQDDKSLNSFYPFLIQFIDFSLNQIFDLHQLNFAYFLPFVSICYKTFKFLNYRSISTFFEENPHFLSQLFFQTTKISMIEHDFTNLDLFLYFSKQSISFCAKMIQKYPNYIDSSVSIQLVQSLLIFFPKFQNQEPVLNSAARLINAFLHYPPTYQHIMSNCGPDFILKIILPFYFINEDDLRDSISDVPQFLAKFQTQDFFYESEYRAYLYESIADLTRKLCDDHTINHLFELIFIIFQSYLETYSKEGNHSILFSFLFLFSSIAPYIPCLAIEARSCLLSNLNQLLLSDSHLVISGVLLCFKTISSSFNHLNYPSPLFDSDVYILVVRLLTEHPSLLVKYYASVAFSEMMNQVNTFEERTIIEMSASYLPQIFKTYMELSSEFHDSEFIQLISTILTVFGGLLIDISPELIKDIFALFLNYQSTSSCVLDTLNNFIILLFHTIDENELSIERNQIISPLLNSIGLVLEISIQEKIQTETIGLIFEFIAELASICGNIDTESIRTTTVIDFSLLFSYDHLITKDSIPLFWNLYEMIPSIISIYGDELVEDGFFALRNIFINDLSNSLVTQKIEFTLNLCFHYIEKAKFQFSDELYASILLLSVVFRFAPQHSIPDIADKYKILLTLIQNGFDEYEFWKYSSLLFLSMLIQNSQVVFELLESTETKAIPFCISWADISEYPVIMLFIMDYSQLFPIEINSEFIKKALLSHKNQADLYGYEDDEAKASSASLLMFNPNEITFYFKQFLKSFSEVHPDVFLGIQQSVFPTEEEEA